MAAPSPEQENKPPLSQSLPALLLAAILVFVVFHELSLFPSPARELPYSEFKQLVLKKQVADLKIGTNTIHGSLLEGAVPAPPVEPAPLVPSTQPAPHQFTTYRVDDPNLVAELEARGIAFSGQADTGWFTNLLSWLLPFVMLLLFWGVYMKRLGTSVVG